MAKLSLSSVVHQKFNASLTFLLIANIYPLYGVLFLDWKLITLYLVYSLEIFIILFYHLLKIVISLSYMNNLKCKQLSWSPFRTKLKIIVIDLGLLVLYAVFFVMIWVLFLYFLICIFAWDQYFGTEIANAKDFPIQIILVPSICFFISHGFSFISNFIYKKEYQAYIKGSVGDNILKNVVFIIVIVSIGAFVISKLPSSIYTLAIFIAIKIIWDIYHHSKEHKSILTRVI